MSDFGFRPEAENPAVEVRSRRALDSPERRDSAVSTHRGEHTAEAWQAASVSSEALVVQHVDDACSDDGSAPRAKVRPIFGCGERGWQPVLRRCMASRSCRGARLGRLGIARAHWPLPWSTSNLCASSLSGDLPLGPSLRRGDTTITIVGICGDARHARVSEPMPPTFDTQLQLKELAVMTFEVRTLISASTNTHPGRRPARWNRHLRAHATRRD